MRHALATSVVLLAAVTTASGQTDVPGGAQGGADAWSFGASAYVYWVPGDEFALPIVTADRGSLHLEARYNYEAQDTGSMWLGWTFGGGTTVEWEITPIFGVVVGDLDGVAPGYEGSLAWRSLELYSEGEYVIDSADDEGSFLYNWSELTVAPTEWLRVGLATQRTRAYESDRDIQRGLLVSLSLERTKLTAYVLNPDNDEPTWIVSLSLAF